MQKRSRYGLCLLLGVLALGALAISSCSTFQQSPKDAIVRDKERTIVPAADVVHGKIFKELFDVADYAALSASAYGDKTYKKTPSLEEFCKTSKTLFVPPLWILHEYEDLPHPLPPPRGYRALRGLRYHVWVRPGSPALAVIAFRGTVVTQFGDWWSNLRWLTRSVPRVWDDYEQTMELAPRLVAFIRAKYGADTEIVTTGHSLGGGLAQEVGYASGVKKVFAFDASAVTGYFSVDRQVREANQQDMLIFRIYEKGEILEALRWFMKILWPLKHGDNGTPRIIEVRFNVLPRGTAVSQHNMKDFACGLHSLAVAPLSIAELR